MDIRQLVLVCENKDEAINNLCFIFWSECKIKYFLQEIDLRQRNENNNARGSEQKIISNLWLKNNS